MLTAGQLEQIRRFAQEIAAREGCLLYDIEFREGPSRTLRIFIDKETGGVSIDDCANVSKGLNLRLDVEDVIGGGHYDLEVSSPGLDRKLVELWHFRAVVGRSVHLRYKEPSGEVKTFDGRLVAVEEDKLLLENSKGPVTIGVSSVERARTVIEDVLKKRPAPGKTKKKRMEGNHGG